MPKFLLFLLLALLTACSELPEAIEPPEENNKTKSSLIYVTSHGWHTGIIIHTNKISPLLPELASRFAAYEYLEIGWGDAGFYQAEKITAVLAVKAILWPTDTVVHVVGFNEKPEQYFVGSEIVKFTVSEAQYKNLMKFLGSSFAESEENEILEMGAGLYGNSQFYKGAGSYFAMNTCNKWTAKALYSAGVKIDPKFKLTASSILKSVTKSINDQQSLTEQPMPHH